MKKGNDCMPKIDFEELHQKLDALLEDHRVDFDDSNLAKDTIDSLHVKTDEIIKAHGLEFNGNPDGSIGALNEKLDLLVHQGHNAEFDKNIDKESIELTYALITKLTEEHGVDD